MSDEAVVVAVDDRARLVSAVLAVSQWPEREQAQLTHAVHPHAKQTRHFLAGFVDHPAVSRLNQALTVGTNLDDFLAAALCCTWSDFSPQEPLPATVDEEWPQALADFVEVTSITSFWAEHDAAWQEAAADLRAIFSSDQLAHFLARLSGRQLERTIVIMPNLTYPALSPVLAETEAKWALQLPLLKAVGESPPWPYREDPATVIAGACQRLILTVLPTILAALNPEQQALLKHAAVTLLLEEAIDEFEAQAYMVRSKKQHNLPRLPLTVEDLRQVLAGDNRHLTGFLSQW